MELARAAAVGTVMAAIRTERDSSGLTFPPWEGAGCVSSASDQRRTKRHKNIFFQLTIQDRVALI